MEFNLLTENITNYRRALLALSIVCATLLLIILLLTGLCFKLKNDRTTVLVPLGLHQAAWVKSGAVSANYLQAMAQNAISLRFNFTPESVDARDKLLLALTTSAQRPSLASVLAKEARLIKDDQISSVFFIKGIQTRIGKELTAQVFGELITYSGAKPVSQEYKRFVLRFQFDGALLLNSFKEVTHA